MSMFNSTPTMIDREANPARQARLRSQGLAALGLFMFCIPLANWMIGNVGTVCVPNGPCLIPVAPGLSAPSGVLLVAVALVLRDIVQRRLGKWASLAAIVVGAGLSAFIAPPSLVLASGAAFLVSELADFAVYTPLQRRRFVLAVVLSSLVGLVVDSVVFLQLAFGDLTYLWGQVVGKAWMVLASVPFVAWLRRSDEARGINPV